MSDNVRILGALLTMLAIGFGGCFLVMWWVSGLGVALSVISNTVGTFFVAVIVVLVTLWLWGCY
ncbi:hypothetical protein LCGC14_0686090 [marine sediment metagenome]|uniref:Uncharacterized protein n=1 Tax=marine sediment metagenome TaxID=412755 RepID=A0A0F9T852_9ZZZZ